MVSKQKPSIYYEYHPSYPGEGKVSEYSKTIYPRLTHVNISSVNEYFGVLSDLPKGWEFQGNADGRWIAPGQAHGYSMGRWVKMRPAQPQTVKVQWTEAVGRIHASGQRIESVGKAAHYPRGVVLSGIGVGVIAEADVGGWVEVKANG
jgi:hypothetical protein